MPTVAPWDTTELLKPWSASAVLTVPACAATRSSRAIPAVLSCAEAARTATATATATASPSTSTARDHESYPASWPTPGAIAVHFRRSKPQSVARLVRILLTA
jgi:hypothetical protein